MFPPLTSALPGLWKVKLRNAFLVLSSNKDLEHHPFPSGSLVLASPLPFPSEVATLRPFQMNDPYRDISGPRSSGSLSAFLMKALTSTSETPLVITEHFQDRLDTLHDCSVLPLIPYPLQFLSGNSSPFSNLSSRIPSGSENPLATLPDFRSFQYRYFLLHVAVPASIPVQIPYR
jgi:hypothetical protein